jgi:acyl-CoA reductase-like NAD-dependent aldehyde dehydrogenase
LRVNTWEEAVAIENANPHGNAAGVYTNRLVLKFYVVWSYTVKVGLN